MGRLRVIVAFSVAVVALVDGSDQRASVSAKMLPPALSSGAKAWSLAAAQTQPPSASRPAGLSSVGDLRLDFGASCDGVHDDTDAIQRWLNAVAPGRALTAPGGTCLFTAPLTVPVTNYYTITGVGGATTTFLYTGRNPTVDLLTVGETGHGAQRGVTLRDFRIASNTVMTAGYALHAHALFSSVISQVVADGKDLGGAGNLCGGIWLDVVGGVDLVTPNVYSKQFCGDGVRASPGPNGGSAEVRIQGGNIGNGFVAGLHAAGGVGGIRCDGTAIHGNTNNFVFDNAVVGASNRDVTLGSTCAFDSAIDDNILIKNSFINGGIVSIGSWAASSLHANGIRIQKCRNCRIAIKSDYVGNNCLDGLYIQDASSVVSIHSSVSFSGNGRRGGVRRRSHRTGLWRQCRRDDDQRLGLIGGNGNLPGLRASSVKRNEPGPSQSK